MPPEVSVILVNYNTFALSCAAIASVYRHTRLSVEVIVVDNASQECDPEAFRSLFPDVILVKSGENGGFAKGNNLGLAQASGQYVLLLNSDAELLNDAIGLSVARLAQSPEVGVLSASLQYPDGRLQYPAQRFETLGRELRELLRLNRPLRGAARAHYYLGDAFDHQSEIVCDWVWGAFFFFRRQVLHQLPGGKLSEDFFMYAEDVQWCYQFRRLGYKVLYYPPAKALHHLGGSDPGSHSAEQKFYQRLLPNRYRLLQLEHGRLYAFACYLVRCLHLLSLRSPDNRRKATAYWRLLRGLPPQQKLY